MSSSGHVARSLTKQYRWVAVGAVLVGLLLALYRDRIANVDRPDYISVAVSVGEIHDSVLASGVLQARRQVSVGAQVSGQLQSLKVQLDEEVQQGQLIAEIDSLAQHNELKIARAALEQVRAQLRSKQALRRQAQLSLRRQQDLLAADAGSREAFESAEATLQGVLADIDSLQAQVEQAHISVGNAQLNLGYTRILAPMDGRVVSVITREGQTVNSAQLAPTIIILADLRTMTVKARVSEADVTRVKPGQKVYFSILGDPDRRFEAALRSVEPAPESIAENADGVGRGNAAAAAPVYYNALFDIANPDDLLRIAMTAQVSIVLSEAHNAILIPATALGAQASDGRYGVRVLVGEEGRPRAEPRQVHLGINNNVYAQVLEGLEVGERVIVGEADRDE